MINKYILEELELNNPKNLDEFENILRELIQKIILFSLSQTTFFQNVAFYGGTCLRLFHGLNRFSEDLDFQVVKKDYSLDLDQYMSKCLQVLESYGLKGIVHSKPEYDNQEVRRRIIKINHYDLANEFFTKISMNKEKNISVKVEISTEFIDGAKYEMKLLKAPFFANVFCFDYPSLFSGKLNALITRNWRERAKGRDYFDYMFYLSHDVKFNMPYLQNKLNYSVGLSKEIITLDKIKELLNEKFNNSDFDSVKKDLIPFIDDKNTIDNLSKDTFILSLEYLMC